MEELERFNRLKSIVKDAGEIIKRGYGVNEDVKKKSKSELVTKYDKEVEEFLISKIKPLYKEYEIVGEESFNLDTLPKRAIFIDPIDGTTNFVHKIPHLAISIGIWDGATPKEAIVYNPILEELYSAKLNEGAFLNNKRISVSKEDMLENSIIATGFPYAKYKMGKEYWWVVESFKRLLPKIRDIRRLGAAALDLCYLAEGRFNGFYEINLKPWDVAGGILILKEAGGEVTTLNNKEYNFTNQIIVASNRAIHSELLRNLGEYNEEWF